MTTAISVRNLTYDYLLLKNPRDLLGAVCLGRGRRYRALADVSFEVARGEALAIIGPNGAGKSTLLKVLAGVLPNYQGVVEVRGRHSAILEVSTSFGKLLTGRQNIRRHLFMQGHSKTEIARLEPEIIEFAELGQVIDHRLITYSNGMKAKLAFATITSAVNEILFIDELLVVGDEYFQGKSYRRIKDICSSGRTVIIASHNLSYSERLCQRAIWLDKGRVQKIGPTHEIWRSYFEHYKGVFDNIYPKEFGYIEAIKVQVANGTMKINSTIMRLKASADLHYQLAIHDIDRGLLAALMNTSWDKIRIPAGLGPLEVSAEIPVPSGLECGLIGGVLVRGSGAIPGSEIQDAWGWDNSKQVYIELPQVEKKQGYVSTLMEWMECT